jgi:tRNA (cytosine49-C5)-methyltransferase
MATRSRGFKKERKKFFYKEDIFLSRMASILKLPQHKLKEFFYQPTAEVIRINKLVKEYASVLNFFEMKGISLEKIPWAEDTYLVKNKLGIDLKITSEFSKGLFTIQNLAEIIPVVVLNPNSKEKVLDMYPGESTIHIANLMNNDGEILALSENPEEVFKKLQKYNVKNTEVESVKGEDVHKRYIDTFDKILLNAPSSREGSMYFTKKRPLKNWSIKKTQALARLQKKLIIAAFKCLKSGGSMVYFTSTISPNENESVVSYLLEQEPEASLEKIDVLQNQDFLKQGLRSWNEEVYHSDISNTLRTIRGKTMIGAYIALIKKR